jgi:hypothetical protein
MIIATVVRQHSRDMEHSCEDSDDSPHTVTSAMSCGQLISERETSVPWLRVVSCESGIRGLTAPARVRAMCHVSPHAAGGQGWSRFGEAPVLMRDHRGFLPLVVQPGHPSDGLDFLQLMRADRIEVSERQSPALALESRAFDERAVPWKPGSALITGFRLQASTPKANPG